MALSSGPIGRGRFRESFERSEFFHVRSQGRYRVQRKEDALTFECTFRDGQESASHRLDYFVGSGRIGRSYLFRIDNFLYQAPVSYYSANARWDLSPGYERYDHLYFARPVEATCLGCHATHVQPMKGTQNGFDPVPFAEPGIGCEMCHGEGDRHVGITSAKPDPHAIVNPARLDAERRDSICARCHLSGLARVDKSERGAASFGPGERFSDFVSVFVQTGRADELKVTSHFETFALSRCKVASGERLWCGTCHNPHAVPAEEDKAEYYRKKCLECHGGHGCTEKTVVRERVGNNCIGCHMPRKKVIDVQHAAYTDHSIRLRPAGAHNVARKGCSIEAFPGMNATDRDLALAYAQIATEQNDSECGARAFDLLRKVEPMNSRDAAVLMQLGYQYDFRAKDREAIALYERALAADPSQITAAINLGAALRKLGQVQRATALWKDVLGRSPASEAASVNLALAEFRSGDVRAAENTLQRALRLSPGSDTIRKLLNALQQRNR